MKGPCVLLILCALQSTWAQEKPKSLFGIPTGPTVAAAAGAEASVPGPPKKSEGAGSPATALPPELETIRASLYSGEQVMRDIFDKKMENFRTAFLKGIDDAAANAEVTLKGEAAAFLRKRHGEMKAAQGPLVLSSQPGDPAEWQTLLKAGRQSLEIWQGQYEDQASKLSVVFKQQLKDAAQAFTGKKQPEGANLAAQMARGLQAWLSLRGRIWASDLEKTAVYGGKGGGRYQHVPPDGGILTGFQYTEKNYSGHPIIGSLAPVYLTPQGEVTGPVFGKPNGPVKTVMAREGYAVAGIVPVSGERLDGFSVIFMRVKEGEAALDPKTRYISDHVGGKGGGKAATPCGDDGRPAVGVWGRCGGDVDSAGLILLGKAPRQP